MRKLKLDGQKFERLVVQKEAGKGKHGKYLWECKCVCGNIVIVRGSDLIRDRIKSCGCLKQEQQTKHGMYKTATYRAWVDMCSRCNNPKNKNYYNYGGRGIKINEEWLKFEAFFAEMGMKPDGLTLERIDNNLGYSKKNCEWADWTTQSRNKRIRKDNQSGVNGINWYKNGKKYRAEITIGYKSVHLGYFTTIEAATEARKQAEHKYWGKDIANIRI